MLRDKALSVLAGPTSIDAKIVQSNEIASFDKPFILNSYRLEISAANAPVDLPVLTIGTQPDPASASAHNQIVILDTVALGGNYLDGIGVANYSMFYPGLWSWAAGSFIVKADADARLPGGDIYGLYVQAGATLYVDVTTAIAGVGMTIDATFYGYEID